MTTITNLISTVSSLSLRSVIHAAAVFSVPVLRFYQPRADHKYLPIICTGIALSILIQAWEYAAMGKQAISEEALMERFKCLREENARLSKLTIDCAAKEARLKILNSELETTHAALKKVVGELKNEEIDLGDRVQQVEKRLLRLKDMESLPIRPLRPSQPNNKEKVE